MAPRVMPSRRTARGWLCALLLCLAAPALAAPGKTAKLDVGALAGAMALRDRALIDAAVAAMPAQTGGTPALYIVGMAGDSTEDVFRNEVRFLVEHVAPRLGAAQRALPLVNHVDSLDAAPAPLATAANLRHALAALAARMDPDRDVLLLYMTMHGTETHELVVRLPPLVDEALTPTQLRDALDDAGIVNRVVVLSACYAGGFIPALRSPDTLVITAAREDRPSFGCGSDATITFFGQAWLLDGLNADPGFAGAYALATRAIKRRERKLDFPRSMPRLDLGDRIAPTLARLQATYPELPPAVYPYPVSP
ncbi:MULTISPECIES: C13 family peptidase [Luteimonas]|uniref:C13 family peptidase n=1 Tax=Luteimonas TaxID=83614 RepID=UPI000C79A30D|nr:MULTISPECIES: C13 family peptidase [Luteimonas]